MKNKLLFLLIVLACRLYSNAQNIGIGTNSPDPSALLDITSTSKGLLVPRMNSSQMTAIASPAQGLLIYNTDDRYYYCYRFDAWTKVSMAPDHLWKNTPAGHVYTLPGSYVGINYTDFSAANLLGNYAPLQTRGMVGNTMALFGENLQGMSLVANYPGIFFNSYFNSGVKSINAGATGNITLNQANPPYYEFSFGDYAGGADQPMSNTPRMALRNDGHLYLGNGNTNFSRAAFEQQGSADATTAIFGGEGAGISLQRNWPAIGFNSYLDGAGHKAIAQGYGAQLGLNQVNGSLYLVSFPFNASPNSTFSSFTQRFYVSRFGQIGIGVDAPLSDIHIVQRTYTDADEGPDMGLTLEGTGSFANFPGTTANMKWNIHTGYGVGAGNFAGIDFLAFWSNHDNAGWFRSAAISNSGSYYQYSDRNRKKDISYLENNFLGKIMALKPAKYHLKEIPQKTSFEYGFIAQDVEEIFPEFVASFKDTKMVAYSSFIPILTKGIQEQQQQIDDLKKENAILKSRLERLEKMVLKNE